MIYGLVFSAGKEKRFAGDIPKTLQLYNGISFLDRNINELKQYCDIVYVVVSYKNKDFFTGYNTIVIHSGLGCGDAVMKSLETLNLQQNDKCFIQWGDCICDWHLFADTVISSNEDCIFVPCSWEISPYVLIEESEKGLNVKFKKYNEVHNDGFHDMGSFFGNAIYILNKLKEFANKIKKGNKYIHKHGNEMQFLDIFNETNIKGRILKILNGKTISFNTKEELKKLQI